jgi:hypothetical protein
VSILVLAVALTWFSETALAQIPPFQCFANGGVSTPSRAEGLAEIVGDMVLNCTGGVPAAFGAVINLVNIQVFLNTSVTSRLLTTSTTGVQYSEALLLLDEPLPASQFACSNTSTICPAYGIGTGNSALGYYGSGTIGASNTNGAYTPIIGNAGACVFNGVGAAGTYPAPIAGCPGNNRNVFQGTQTTANSVTFLSVPIDPPGANSRVIRITNIRADANALGVPNISMPTPIVETVSTNPPLPVSNPSQTVAFIAQGAFASLSGSPIFSQCSSQNQALADDPTQSGAAQFNVTFQEQFSTAFKQRNIATSASTPNALADQNNLTTGVYNTESAFYNNSFPAIPGDNLALAGLADQGTRLLVSFQNIPTGVSLYTQVAPPVSGPDVVRRTNTDANGAGPFSMAIGNSSGLDPIPLVGGSGIAVFEDIQSDPNTFATVTVPIYVAYDATSGLPVLGSGTVSAALAPVSVVTTADAAAPVPRFAVSADLTGQTAFTINPCSCASNMSAPITVTRGGFFLNFGTGRFQQNVTIKNTGNNSIAGPISLALDNLSANAALANAAGVTSCASPAGSPYIAVNVGSALAPGASASVVLQFTHTGSAGISYNTRMLGGSGGR